MTLTPRFTRKSGEVFRGRQLSAKGGAVGPMQTARVQPPRARVDIFQWSLYPRRLASPMPGEVTARIEELNTDILLNIISFLAIEDYIAFLGTCATIRSLGHSKASWIYALQNTRLIRPLPLPHNTRLWEQDITRLQKAAYHAQRLGQNWNRASPEPLDNIQRVSFGSHPDTQIVSLIPGANIVVIFSSPYLVCYSSSIQQKSAPLLIGDYCWRISRGYFEQPGQFLVTVATGNDRMAPSDLLHLIEITYAENEVPMMRIRATKPLTPSFFDAFVFDNVMGYIWVGEGRKYYVSAWNYVTDERVDFVTGLRVSASSVLACYLDHGHLYLIREDQHSMESMRYHRSMLPYTPDPERNNKVATFHHSASLIERPYTSVGLSPGFSNSYGVVAVSARSEREVPDLVHSHFYVIHSSPDEFRGELLEAEPVRLAARVQRVLGTEEALTSVRPTCAVYVLDRGESHTDIHLQIVRYLGLGKDKVDKRHIVVLPKRLHVRSWDITSITSDDYMGVIYLTTRSGELLTVQFA